MQTDLYVESSGLVNRWRKTQKGFEQGIKTEAGGGGGQAREGGG